MSMKILLFIKQNKIKVVIFLVGLLFLLYLFIFKNFVNYEKVEFTDVNPTKYCFDFQLDSVKSAIKNEFEKAKYRDGELKLKEDENHYEYTKNYFSVKANQNDAVLITGGNNNFNGYSFIYYRDGKPLDYWAIYKIHITDTAEKKTCIEVIADCTKVRLGPFFTINHSLSFREDRYISVESSTIEEYEILYLIGRRLGQKNMPKVKYPNKKEKRITLKYYTIAPTSSYQYYDREKKEDAPNPPPVYNH